ncbi:hypothetical protein MACH24_31570 [Erythrobacter sp. Dej080120_24]|nr:hypothetical protein MACH24_31570 [Erythrobacter sp. Dej080120_24]
MAKVDEGEGMGDDIHEHAEVIEAYDALGFDGEPFRVEVKVLAGTYYVSAGDIYDNEPFSELGPARAAALHIVDCYPPDAEGTYLDQKPRYKLARTHVIQDPPTGSHHTIRIEYVNSLSAAHGITDRAEGAHSILVDDVTLEKIRQGKEVKLLGQGIRLYDEGPFEDEWFFNNPPGAVTVFLDTLNEGERDWLEAIAIWIDDEQQPKPPGYFV